VDDWGKVSVAVPLQALFRDDWAILKGVRTCAAWLSCAEDVKLGAALECADETAAGKVRQFLAPDGKGIQALGLRPDSQPILRDFQQTLKTTQQGTWVNLSAVSDQKSAVSSELKADR
jgi:hypothetical protein